MARTNEDILNLVDREAVDMPHLLHFAESSPVVSAGGLMTWAVTVNAE